MYKFYTNKFLRFIGQPVNAVRSIDATGLIPTPLILRKIVMRMKIIALLLVVLLVQVSAKSSAQKLTYSAARTSIDAIFKEITRQTGYDVVYAVANIDKDRRISVNFKDTPLDKVMDVCLNNSSATYVIEDKTILIKRQTRDAQKDARSSQVVRPIFQQRILGRVTDKDGVALPDVTVTVKGSNKGTTADANGNYSLEAVDENAILVFSLVGYHRKEEIVRGRRQINVVLEQEVAGLDEVVVVGFGTVKKSDVTSSISKIGGDAFAMQPLPTLGEALAGRLAGVRAQHASGKPGADLKIRIRGVNSITGNTNPLYVIDGIPRENMEGINPSDIESIQVLKDASASSIYGSRGGNGIVLIETKKATGKPTFSVETYAGFQENAKKLPMMNKNEFLAYHSWIRNEMWLRQGGSMKDPISSRPSQYRLPDEWFSDSREDTDWQDIISVRAPMQNYHISGSGKGDVGSFYLSAGYVDQDGTIFNTYYKRADLRFNGTLNVGDNVTIGANLAPSFSTADDRGSEGKELVLHHALLQPPIVQVDEATRDWGYPAGLFLNFPNSLERLKQTTNNTRQNIFNTSIWGEYRIIDGLTFKTLLNYDSRNQNYEYFQAGNVVFVSGIAQGSSNSSTAKDVGIQNTLTFDRTFADHTLNAVLGQTTNHYTIFNINAVATGWPNDLIETLNVANRPTTASTTKYASSSASFFGRVSYGFQDKYLVNASLRYDGSSRFGQDNRWGLFPSVSMGWKVNNEQFLEDNKWINLLKVRGSWGMAGNDRIGYYDYMAMLSVVNNTWGESVVSGLAPRNMENQLLRWESTKTTNIGVDFWAFNNRLQFSFDYFDNVTDDLLFNVPLPSTTGFTSFRDNVGSVSNSGWELDLTTTNTTGLIDWRTSFNLSKTHNKVLDMGGVNRFVETFWGAQFITAVGGPVSQYYLYRTDGLLMPENFDGQGVATVPILPGQKEGNVKYIDQNGDGLINSMDLVPYGSNIPDFVFGFTNTIGWKDLTLSFLLQGQVGGEVMFLGSRNYDDGANITFNQFNRWLRAYKPDYESIYGPGENPIPNIEGVDMTWDGETPYVFDTKFDGNSDFRVYDSSFLRVKNVTLNYKIPQSLIGRIGLTSAQVYTSVSNLLTFDNYPGWNVEADNQGLTQQGVDYVTYPLSRTFTIGAKLSF